MSKREGGKSESERATERDRERERERERALGREVEDSVYENKREMGKGVDKEK